MGFRNTRARRSILLLGMAVAGELLLWNGAAVAAPVRKVIPHIVSGDGFVTKMTIMNLSTSTNNITVKFFSQAGSLLETTVLSLPPGGTRRLATREEDRFAAATTRWATIDASFPVGVNLFFELKHAGSDLMVTSVGFNDALPVQGFTLPVEFEAARPGDPAPRTVGLALANVSAVENSVLLKLVDSNGAVLAQDTVTLGPLAQTAFNVENRPAFRAALPAGSFIGTVAVTATGPVSAIGVGDDFGPFFGIPVIPARASNLVVPHIVSGDGFVTKMTIMNLSTSTNNITVRFFSQAGSLLETLLPSLPPGGTRRLATREEDRFAAATTRWATIDASFPVGVNLFFELKHAGSDLMVTSVGFNDALPVQGFTLPVEFEAARPGDPAPRTVGLALANVSAVENSVLLKLVDSNGAVLAQDTVTLGPLAQTAFNVENRPAFRAALPAGSFIGTVVVTATGPVSAIGVGDDFGPFFGIPVKATPIQVMVEMRYFAFDPRTLTIPVDSTVTWDNQEVSAQHSATSDNGSFDTGLFNPGGRRSITFTTPGNFPYYCILHGDAGGSGMAAILIVKE